MPCSLQVLCLLWGLQPVLYYRSTPWCAMKPSSPLSSRGAHSRCFITVQLPGPHYSGISQACAVQPSSLLFSIGPTAGALLPFNSLGPKLWNSLRMCHAAFKSSVFYRAHSRCFITVSLPEPQALDLLKNVPCSLQVSCFP